MKNSIPVKKKRLIFREDAKKLVQFAHQKVVYLDFSNVDFFSRSFVDEFLNCISELERAGVKVHFLNLRPALREFIVRVKKMKSKIRKTLLQNLTSV